MMPGDVLLSRAQAASICTASFLAVAENLGGRGGGGEGGLSPSHLQKKEFLGNYCIKRGYKACKSCSQCHGVAIASPE